jgi:hypothetical protein
MAGFFSSPRPSPKGEGAFTLLPEGEGVGMRGERYLHYEVTAIFRFKIVKKYPAGDPPWVFCVFA